MQVTGKISDYVRLTEWGTIQGDIEHQTDLIDRLNNFEKSVNTQITTEVNDRMKADDTLDGRLTSESNARETADNKLRDEVTSSIETLAKDLDNEVNERIIDVSKVRIKTQEVERLAKDTSDILKEHESNADIHVSLSDRSIWNNKQNKLSQGDNIIISPECIISATVPTKVSDLENDLEFQDALGVVSIVSPLIDDKVNRGDFEGHTNNLLIHVSTDDRDGWNKKLSYDDAVLKFKKLQSEYDSDSEGVILEETTDFISRITQDAQGRISVERKITKAPITSYEDLTEKPHINGVELIGDQSADDLGIHVPTRLSQLENDSEANFVNIHVNNLDNYYDKDTTETLIKNTTYTKDEIGTKLSEKQDNLSADKAISINGLTNKISVKFDNDTIKLDSEGRLHTNARVGDVKVDGTSVVVDGVADIDLTSKQNKLVEGANIHIDPITNEISASGSLTTVSWGGISGNILNQSDLINKFNGYILSSNVSAIGKSGDYNDISYNKPVIPTKTSQLTNDSGFITSAGSGFVTDVKVINSSIVTSGVAVLDVPTDSLPGVIYKLGNLGVTVDSGVIKTSAATEAGIKSKSDSYNVIVPSNLNIAIREGLGNNGLVWTDDYKDSARATINAAKNIDASSSVKGIVQAGAGINATNGVISVATSSEGDIAAEVANKYIDAAHLSYAVESALTDGVAYSSSQQDKARAKINAAKNAVATATTPGLTYGDSKNGIYMGSGGLLILDQATATDIKNRESTIIRAITAENYDEAVKDALCYSPASATWSADELAAAQTKLGFASKQDVLAAGTGIEIVDSTISTKIDGTTITTDSTGALICTISGLTDVKVNNTSVKGTDNIAYIRTADDDTYGVVLLNSIYGIKNVDGAAALLKVSNTDITERKQFDNEGYGAITTQNFDYAVKMALTDDVGAAYTAAQRRAARERLGIYTGTSFPASAVSGDILFNNSNPSAITIEIKA